MLSLLNNIANLHLNIAKDVYPKGGWLHCKYCDRWEVFTTEIAANYLAHGWPKCCGHSMTTIENPPSYGGFAGDNR